MSAASKLEITDGDGRRLYNHHLDPHHRNTSAPTTRDHGYMDDRVACVLIPQPSLVLIFHTSDGWPG